MVSKAVEVELVILLRACCEGGGCVGPRQIRRINLLCLINTNRPFANASLEIAENALVGLFLFRGDSNVVKLIRVRLSR